MEVKTWPSFAVVVDPKEIDRLFGKDSPYNLSSQYASLHISEDGSYDISARIGEELRKGGPRKDNFVKVAGSINSIFVAKIRIGDSERGKSHGYRAITLVVPPITKAFLLGIKKHVRSSSDTVISDKEKSKLKRIVDMLEKDAN